MPRRDLNHSLCIGLVVALFVLAGCSRLKKLSMALSRGVDPRLRHEEVVRIDQDVYVKVPNPEAQAGEPFRRYLYVPAHEYLANPESYNAVVMSVSTPQQDEWRPVQSDAALPPETLEGSNADQVKAPLHFKKRLMVLPFNDLANPPHRELSDIFMQKLALKIESTSDQVTLFDADIMKQTQEDKKISHKSLDSLEIARLAGQLYNIHAVVTGTINHVFISSRERTVKGKSKTTYAIAEISVRLIDTATGTIRRQWEKSNPFFDSEGNGDFSEEKAQLKAIELVASELGQDIIEELKRLDWYTTVANVDGNRVYISAGKLSGVRVGDTFSVYPGTSPNNPRGEIRIATLFGIDASVGDITKGKGFRANDLVRPVFQ